MTYQVKFNENEDHGDTIRRFLSPGDTVWLFWLATDSWVPVNYRGLLESEKAVVIKDGVQFTVNVNDLRITTI